MTGLANCPSVTAGALWGLAGDCYFARGELDRGFGAYRRAIDLDPHAGCLPLFACAVAKYGRAQDAELALICLDASWQADKTALRRHPLHFLRWSLKPDFLYFRFVKLPSVRRRLRRLAAEWRDANGRLGSA